MSHYSELFNHVDSPVAFISRDYTLDYTNEAYARFFNREPKELKNIDVCSVEYFKWPDNFKNKIDICFEGKSIELPVLNKHNNTYNVVLRPNYFENNTVSNVFVTIKKGGQNHHSKNNYIKLINSLPDAVFVLQDGVIKFTNPTLCEISEYSKEELIGVDFTKFIAPENIANVVKYYTNRLKGNKTPNYYESTAKTKSGKYIPVEVAVIPIEFNDREAWQVILKDISKYKIALNKLAESEEKYRFITETTLNGIIIHKKGVLLDCNQAFLNITGFSREEAIGENMLSMVPSEKARKIIQEQIQKQYAKPYIVELARKDGSLYFAELEGHETEFKGEKVRLVSLKDITERKKTETELKKQKDFLWLLIDNMPNQIFWKDKNLVYKGCNKEFADVIGLESPKIIKGKTDFDFIRESDNSEDYQNWDKKVLESGKPVYNIEEPYLNAKGEEGVVLTSKIPLFDKDKNVDGLLGFCVDITNRKKAEKELKQSEEKFRGLFENANIGIAIGSTNGTVEEVNQQYLDITGYTESEFIGINYASITHPSDLEIEAHLIEEIIENKRDSYRIEKRLKGKDEEFIWLDSAITSIRNDKGQLERLIALVFDITEKRKATESMNAFFEQPISLHLISSIEGKIVNINAGWENILGFKKEELLGTNFLELVHPDDIEATKKVMKLLEQGETISFFELRGKHKKGHYKNLAWSGIASRNDQQIHAVGNDVTEQKIAEQKTKQSQDLLSRFIDHLPDDAWTKDKNGRMTMVNKYIKEVTLERDDLVGKTAHDFFPKEVADKLWESEKQIFTKGKTIVNEEKIPSKNGYRDKVLTKFPLFNNEGEVSGIGAIAHDITERKKAENEALRSANFANALLKSLSVPTYYKNKEGKYTGCNKAFADFHGILSQDIIGRTVDEVFGNEWALAKRSLDIETLQKQENQVFEFDLLDKEGNEKHVMYSENIIYDENNEASGIIGSFLDISHHVFEEKLKTAQVGLMEKSLSQNVSEIIKSFLTEAEKLTNSQISFYHFISDDQENILIQEWSDNTAKKYCKVVDMPNHYPISKAGVWVDCVHERKPVVHNNYENLAHKKGMPEGHAPLVRELVVPVIRGEKVKAIFGVGNKPTNYSEDDTKLIQQLADFAWEIIDRKLAQEELKSKNKLLELEKEKVLANEQLLKEHVKQIEKSEKRYRDLFEHTPIALWEEDLSEVIQFLNELKEQGKPLTTEFFKENPEILQSCLSKIKVIDVNQATLFNHEAKSKEILCSKLPELFTDVSLEVLTNWIIEIANGSDNFSSQSQTITLNGEVRDTFMKAHLDRESSTIILAVIDTTEQKKAEREIKKYQEHLEELVHKRTEALEESNKEMEAFSYSVSHDLRAPLRAISGFSKFLIEDYEDILDAEGNRYLNVINENTDKMDKLITDLLKLSRTSRAELKYIELNMKALARSMYMEVATEEEQKDFEFIINDSTFASSTYPACSRVV